MYADYNTRKIKTRVEFTANFIILPYINGSFSAVNIGEYFRAVLTGMKMINIFGDSILVIGVNVKCPPEIAPIALLSFMTIDILKRGLLTVWKKGEKSHENGRREGHNKQK